MRHPARLPRRRAAVLPLVTVCLVGLLAFVALAIDVGMLALARTQAQAAADVGALAGTRTLNGTTADNNKVNAEAEAKEAATCNSILGTRITASQVTTQSGVYRYSTADARFTAQFDVIPTSAEAYGAMRVIVSADQATYFGKMLGVSTMRVSAQATAVHRPRDIVLSLDFSGSMRYSSQLNYPTINALNPNTNVTGSLSPDHRYPRFGPWVSYPVATSEATSTPMMFGGAAYVDSGGETHAANNLTTATNAGEPIVLNFQTNAGSPGTNAFVYNGDLTAGSFRVTNTPVCTPAPETWAGQYASGYQGDRWPLKWGNASTAPAAADYAKHVADIIYLTPLPLITNSLLDVNWEANGYDSPTLTFKNGAFRGYSMGPGYYGKTFYIWPPDPRYTAGADPTSISPTNPVQDTGGRWIADWRKRFFLYPSNGASNKGAPMDDNSRLWDTANGNVGVWRPQGVGGGSLQYVPNYDAILKWIKSGPQTLPPSLRAGRVLYYASIPDAIPMNWQTGLISGSATDDERFWKEYIDFVIGCGRHNRLKTLYGQGTTNTVGATTFGTPQITPKSSLSGLPAPYMKYTDCPVHPRLHMWFGPLTMLGFLCVGNDTIGYNWIAGTTSDAPSWQLKAGIRSALVDIKKNHPNDLASLNFWSWFNGYATPRVAMGRDFDKMRNCLYYPFSLVDSLGTVTSEKRPYKADTAISNSNPCGLAVDNYSADVPCPDGATCPAMGLMLAYNQFNWSNGYTGRNGAAKLVILETDGVPNEKVTGTFSALGTGGRYHWTGVADGGLAPLPFNGHPDAMNPAITLAWLITQDAAGSNPWPTLPAYANGTGLASAGSPTKWNGLNRNGPGYTTARNPARVHTIAFGDLFESTNTSAIKTRALEFLRNVQVVGGTSASGASSIESYKVITGTSTERVTKLKEALERIMQAGVQVALIE